MENSPFDAGKDEDEDKAAGKKKKKATRLGGFAVEPKKADHQPTETAEDIWTKLSLVKRKGGRSEAAVPLAELPETADRTSEAAETDLPLDTLSPTEERFVSQEIVATQRQAEAEQPIESAETSGLEAAVLAAVEQFRDKITKEGRTPDQAFAETLDDLTAESPAATALEAPIGKEADNKGASSEPPTPPPGAGPAGHGHHFAPQPAETATPVIQKEVVPYYNNEDLVGAAFLGGLVGYLIGRRRGRIKTQKKLLPVQKKLEKQVSKLQQDIQRKEFYIREVARDQNRDRQKIFQMEQANKKTEQGRPKAPEANQLHGEVAPERIGRVLMTADEAPETKAAKPSHPEKPVASLAKDKRVETLSRSELLRLSERINVENTTLRQVYETHLVSEQGLRRLVNEYLRGGNVQEALRGELVEHEIDFERDPVLRDHSRPRQGAAAADNDSPTLSGLLRKAGVADTDHHDDFTKRAEQLYKDEPHSPPDSHRRFVDMSLIAIIFILLLLVLVLVVSRQ